MSYHDEPNVNAPFTLSLAVARVLELVDVGGGVEGPGGGPELDGDLMVHPALPGLLGAGGAVHAHEHGDAVLADQGVVEPGEGEMGQIVKKSRVYQSFFR